MITHKNSVMITQKNLLFEMHQYDIKICHYNMTVFAMHLNGPADLYIKVTS